jgi:tetratricopeptide (TPR) repeat protein
MGYMGFGLQKWIYRQMPRNAFSKERKLEYDSISKNHHDFSPKPAIKPTKNKQKALVSIGILLILISFSVYLISTFYKYSHNRKNTTEIELKKIEKQAFKVLCNSGIVYFERQNWSKAKAEFELALKLEPDDLKLNLYFAQTLLWLCKSEKQKCTEAIEYLNSISSKHPKNENIKKLIFESELIIASQN